MCRKLLTVEEQIFAFFRHFANRARSFRKKFLAFFSRHQSNKVNFIIQIQLIRLETWKIYDLQTRKRSPLFKMRGEQWLLVGRGETHSHLFHSLDATCDEQNFVWGSWSWEKENWAMNHIFISRSATLFPRSVNVLRGLQSGISSWHYGTDQHSWTNISFCLVVVWKLKIV